MIETLIFNGGFAYEAERQIRCFFPPLKLKLLTDCEPPEDNYILTAVQRGSDTIRITVDLRDGQLQCAAENVPSCTDDTEIERLLDVCIYRVLSRYTGQNPPWGILTGIRPVRLYEKRLPFGDADAFFRDKYLVSADRTELSKRISAVQLPIIESIMPRSFSLYVSIPFCPTRCSYCSFVSHSVEDAAKLIPQYVELLCREIRLTAELTQRLGMTLDTVYFGGGTPTALSAEQLDLLFEAVKSFDLSNVREYTVEAGRPDTITREKLTAIKHSGATRISVNPQTMSDNVLAVIGRRHSVADTVTAFKLAREVGFDNINMDLIAGLPTDTVDGFKRSVDAVLELNPNSVTVHSLTLKRSSTLFREEYTDSHGEVGEMVTYSQKALPQSGYNPYYLYRQKNTLENLENVGYAKSGKESFYNVFIMEEVQTIIACGCAGSSKLVAPSGKIERVMNYKFPYEYISRFDGIVQKKEEIAALLKTAYIL